MKKVVKPNIELSDVFNACISNFRRGSNLKEKFESAKDDIFNSAGFFIGLAEQHETFKMVEKVIHSNTVTSNELIKLYTNKFVPENSPGRKYYDEILSAPKNGICPLCGERIVHTLDHYLNKSTFPSLSIAPENLIPSCRDCNTDKLDYTFTCKEDETLHPYYDDIGDVQWLECIVNKTNPISFTFKVRDIVGCDITLQKRIEKHFNVYKLQNLYSSKAAQEMSEIETKLKKLYTTIGIVAVKIFIQEEIESRSVSGVNNWRVVFYTGLFNSNWFLTEWISGRYLY